mgnify:FL=1
MTDETNNTQAPQENTPAQEPAERTPVQEMAELITGTLRRHMEGFIGQQDTPTTRDRINAALNTWAENVDPPQLGRARALFDTEAIAEAPIDDGLGAAPQVVGVNDTGERLVVRRAEGTGAYIVDTDNATTITDGRIFRSNATTNNYFTTSLLDELKSSNTIKSKYTASPEDERLHTALSKAEDAFKDMDYSTCHQLIGEFLEIHKGVPRADKGKYRSDGGRLPNYVPISTVNEMVHHFIESRKMLVQGEETFEAWSADLKKYRGKLPHVTLEEVIHHALSTYRSAIRMISHSASLEVGHIWDDRHLDEPLVEEDSLPEAEEPPEELSEAERLVIEIARTQMLQEEQRRRNYQRDSGDPIAPPLRGVGLVHGADVTEDTEPQAVQPDPNGEWRMMQGTAAQIRDELEHAALAQPEVAMNVAGQAAAGGG